MSTNPVTGGAQQPHLPDLEPIVPAAQPASTPAAPTGLQLHLDFGFSRPTLERLGIGAPASGGDTSTLVAQVLAENDRLRKDNEGARSSSLSGRIRSAIASDADVAARLGQLADDAARIEEQGTALREERDSRVSERTGKQGESTQLGQQIATEQGKINAFQNQADARQGDIDALSAGIAALEADIAALDPEDEDYADQHEALNTQLAGLAADRDAATTARNDALSARDAAIAARDGLVAQQGTLDDEIDALTATIGGLDASIAANDSALAEKEQEFQTVQNGGGQQGTAERDSVQALARGSFVQSLVDDLVIGKILEEMGANDRIASRPVLWGVTAEELATQYQDNETDRRATAYGEVIPPDVKRNVARKAEQLALTVAAALDALSSLDVAAQPAGKGNTRLRLDL